MEIKDVEVRVSRQDNDYRLVFDYLEPSMQNLVTIPKEAYLALAEHFSSKKDVVRYSLIEKDNPSAERLSWDFKKKALENGLSESEVNKMIISAFETSYRFKFDADTMRGIFLAMEQMVK